MLCRSWRANAAVLTGLLAAGCSVNPATGEREFALIGEQQEIEMGREADAQIVATLGVYDDPELTQYVQSLGARIAAASERPGLPWTFRVVDDATVNAFALPGGFVYVTRGILTHLRSEAELIGVLGHEVGHVTARHSVSQLSRAQLAQLGLGLGMIFVPELRPFGDVAGVGMQLLFLKYGRDDESEADMLGVRYMDRLRYDPRELSSVMRMLERSSEISGGSGRVPEWLSSHPDPGNRAERIGQLVQESGVNLTGVQIRRSEYLREIDGTVFGDNPREGFFRENVFHHPDLAFRFTFPRGWSTANTKQAVQAMAPDQDAAIEITLAEGAPSQALASFGSQQGVTLLRTGQEALGGITATGADFAAASDQGVFLGRVLFFTYANRTYRLLGYAPEARWSRHQTTVEQSLASFQRETDAQVLGVRPNRLTILQLDQSASLENFLRRYPTPAAPELVALINGWESGATLPAGTLVKRVASGS
jgi:predicted Zn-dependent protease